MTLTSALHISAGALQVHQAGISIVSNNIANMNTEGYHKQKLNLGTNVIGLPIGNNVYTQVKTSIGVEAISVERYTTSFLGSYYRDELADQAYKNKQADGLADVANMFDELGGKGLDKALQGFYDALDNLNQYPNDMAARVNLLNAASTLTSSMNAISSNLGSLNTQSVGDGTNSESLKNSEIYSDITKINNTLDELASVNKMIALSQTGTLENNNLLDKRDRILNSLAEYGNFNIDILSNGVANVSLGGIKLVGTGDTLAKLDVQTAAQYKDYCLSIGMDEADITNTCNAVIMIRYENGSVVQNANDKFTTGKLGAIIDSASDGGSEGVKNILNSLDTLAGTIADVFNTLQTRDGAFYLGISNDGRVILDNTDLNQYAIFTANDGSGVITAGNISVNSLLLADGGYNKIAAAYFENYDVTDPTTYDLNAVGNATNIVAMISTKSNNTAATFDPIGHISLSDYYNGILNKAATLAQSAADSAAIQNSVVDSLNNKIAEQTSVDLNEELTDLIKFQTAYSASARVFSTCNNLLDTLINLGL